MTNFPSVEWPAKPSQRMGELLKKAGPGNPDLSVDEVILNFKEGRLCLEHGPIQNEFLKLWLESMLFFFNRRHADWGVFFQLGLRDLENFWRDVNTQQALEISSAHQDFENAWQAMMAQKFASCLAHHQLSQADGPLNYPAEVDYWTNQIRTLNLWLRPHVSLELISFEKKEVLIKEEKKPPQADRLVFTIEWPSLGQTWMESAKMRWAKNFFQTIEALSGPVLGRPLKWVAEGGQFP